MFKPFPRNQLATKEQSFPRKSSNAASPMIARHTRNFTWNGGCSSNSPPLTHGDQILHPPENSDNQIPSSPGWQRCQMPGVCPGGMLKLRFDRYITVNGWFVKFLHRTNFDSTTDGAWKGYIWDFKGLRYWSKLMPILQNCLTKMNISSLPLEKTRCGKNNFLKQTLGAFHSTKTSTLNFRQLPVANGTVFFKTSKKEG